MFQFCNVLHSSKFFHYWYVQFCSYLQGLALLVQLIKGDTVAQFVELPPLSQKVAGPNPRSGPFWVELSFSRYTDFLPQPKNVHVTLNCFEV